MTAATTSVLPLTNGAPVIRASLRVQGREVVGTVLAEWEDEFFPFAVWSVYRVAEGWQPHNGSYHRTEDDAVEAYKAATR